MKRLIEGNRWDEHKVKACKKLFVTCQIWLIISGSCLKPSNSKQTSFCEEAFSASLRIKITLFNQKIMSVEC